MLMSRPVHYCHSPHTQVNALHIVPSNYLESSFFSLIQLHHLYFGFLLFSMDMKEITRHICLLNGMTFTSPISNSAISYYEYEEAHK